MMILMDDRDEGGVAVSIRGLGAHSLRRLAGTAFDLSL